MNIYYTSKSFDQIIFNTNNEMTSLYKITLSVFLDKNNVKVFDIEF